MGATPLTSIASSRRALALEEVDRRVARAQPARVVERRPQRLGIDLELARRVRDPRRVQPGPDLVEQRERRRERPADGRPASVVRRPGIGHPRQHPLLLLDRGAELRGRLAEPCPCLRPRAGRPAPPAGRARRRSAEREPLKAHREAGRVADLEAVRGVRPPAARREQVPEVRRVVLAAARRPGVAGRASSRSPTRSAPRAAPTPPRHHRRAPRAARAAANAAVRAPGPRPRPGTARRRAGARRASRRARSPLRADPRSRRASDRSARRRRPAGRRRSPSGARAGEVTLTPSICIAAAARRVPVHRRGRRHADEVPVDRVRGVADDVGDHAGADGDEPQIAQAAPRAPQPPRRARRADRHAGRTRAREPRPRRRVAPAMTVSPAASRVLASITTSAPGQRAEAAAAASRSIASGAMTTSMCGFAHRLAVVRLRPVLAREVLVADERVEQRRITVEHARQQRHLRHLLERHRRLDRRRRRASPAERRVAADEHARELRPRCARRSPRSRASPVAPS